MAEAFSKYTVKTTGTEFTLDGRPAAEELIARAASAGIDLSPSDLHGSAEGEIPVPNRCLGELIVDNSKVNREGQGEAYLSCCPELSSLPPLHPLA